jgi:hypothetical protein
MMPSPRSVLVGAGAVEVHVSLMEGRWHEWYRSVRQVLHTAYSERRVGGVLSVQDLGQEQPGQDEPHDVGFRAGTETRVDVHVCTSRIRINEGKSVGVSKE